MSTGLYRSIAVGAGWMVLLRWVDRLISMGSIVVLARLLLPADFGLVGYGMAFLTFLELFFMFSFETALIRDQHAGPESYNTAWTLEVSKGFVIAMLMVVGAPFAATFFREPEVQTILYWLAPYPILRGLENIGIVDFQKNLTLHKDFYLRSSVKVVCTTVTIGVAYVMRNYWALICGTLLQGVLRVMLSYVMSDFRPRLSLRKFSEIFGFSKWLVFQNFFSTMNQQFPVFIIGRYVNAQALAYFNMGVELANIVTTEMAAPIRRALLPGVAKMQGDREKMANSVVMTLGLVVLVGLPATIGLGIVTPLFVPLMLGDKWIELVPVLQVLTIYAVSEVFYTNSHVIYYTDNRPHITAFISVLRFLVLVPIVMWLVPEYGAIGGAWALVIANWALKILEYVVLVRTTAVTVSSIVTQIWRSVVASALMSGAVWWAMHGSMFESVRLVPLKLAIVVLVGVVTYGVSMLLLWRLSGKAEGPERIVVKMLGGAMRHPVVQRFRGVFGSSPR